MIPDHTTTTSPASLRCSSHPTRQWVSCTVARNGLLPNDVSSQCSVLLSHSHLSPFTPKSETRVVTSNSRKYQKSPCPIHFSPDSLFDVEMSVELQMQVQGSSLFTVFKSRQTSKTKRSRSLGIRCRDRRVCSVHLPGRTLPNLTWHPARRGFG